MKIAKTFAVSAAVSMALTLAACSNDDNKAAETSSSSASSSSQADAQAPMPTAADLNAIVAIVTDPNAPIEEKQQTLQGEDVDPVLFDQLVRSKQESGAEIVVVDPVLPGYTPNSVFATVNVNLPESDPQVADDVEFVYEDGRWKLTRRWACTLLKFSVPQEQMPQMCLAEAAPPVNPPADAAQPAPEGEQPAPDAPPAPEAPEAPAPDAPAPDAPAPAQ
ncbi:hypothetical protein [Corynebacterium gerontici]|uniref:Low molecular weight antigen MTB12-like C-terminal domain-containing protein n=1 Tax=Corynebacterium gerontici TaxID=2079234 RepID=A0A3G6J1F0_9CORY|nr:hypothetical protein [Corynebacterium gerontici]AZA11756.1 hypothetical protein CGERO_07280 [Corynebacterium gerontici]